MSEVNCAMNARIEVVKGDITCLDVDAIVNAANSGLRGGGGVDGAIHRAGGPEIMAQCRVIGHCPTGQAVITTAGRLPARYVIHTVGPVYREGDPEVAALLYSAYRTSLELAVKQGDIRSIAFPSISTGVYGYPFEDASRIALSAARDFIANNEGPLETILFVLYSNHDYSRFKTLFNG